MAVFGNVTSALNGLRIDKRLNNSSTVVDGNGGVHTVYAPPEGINNGTVVNPTETTYGTDSGNNHYTTPTGSGPGSGPGSNNTKVYSDKLDAYYHPEKWTSDYKAKIEKEAAKYSKYTDQQLRSMLNGYSISDMKNKSAEYAAIRYEYERRLRDKGNNKKTGNNAGSSTPKSDTGANPNTTGSGGSGSGSNTKSISELSDSELQSYIDYLKNLVDKLPSAMGKIYEYFLEKAKDELLKRKLKQGPTDVGAWGKPSGTGLAGVPGVTMITPTDTNGGSSVPKTTSSPTNTTTTPTTTTTESTPTTTPTNTPTAETPTETKTESFTMPEKTRAADVDHKDYRNVYLIGSGNYNNDDGTVNKNRWDADYSRFMPNV